MRRDKESKTLQNGGKQESRSGAGRGILWVASEVISGAVLYDLVFFGLFLFYHERHFVILHLLQPGSLVCW